MKRRTMGLSSTYTSMLWSLTVRCSQITQADLMKHLKQALAVLPLLILSMSAARAANYPGTIAVFKNAGASSTFFSRSYAYAVFPTVGSGAIGVGGAYGKGRVYVHGVHTGDATLGQVSVGFQAGGKAYSQIIFFEDKRALDEFESGNFEFGADASVVAVTAGANAGAATNGASAGVSAGQNDARTRGVYQKGMAVFTVAKGGLMYSASIAGQKFSYTPSASK
jgi:lipid-binding SYLF domain-containing protein